MNTSPPLVLAALLATPSPHGVLLRTHAGDQPLYASILKAMGECREVRPVLVTDLPEAAALARKLSIETLWPDRKQSPEGDPFEGPPYFDLIARTLEAHGFRTDGQTPAAVLDPRWPLLSADTISRALEAFRSLDPPLLASASPTTDNPVQALRGFRILDAGTVAFLEDHGQKSPQWLCRFNEEQHLVGNAAPYLTTCPFFLNWKDFSGSSPADGGIAALCWMAYAPDQVYFFTPRENLTGSYSSQSVVVGYYQRESQNLARHLVSSYWLGNVYPHNLVGLDPISGTSSPGAICLIQGDSLLLCLPELEYQPHAILRIWPFRAGRMITERALEVPLGEQGGGEKFLWNQSIRLALRLPCGLPGIADGFCYALMVPDNREADFMEPLIFQNGPYRYDPQTRALTTSGGERIAGRQHFAPLNTLNTALTILRFQDLPNGAEHITSQNVAAFALSEAEAQCVEDELDLARIG